MAVYVDEILDWTLIAQARGLRRTHWCHLTADTEQELHAFAARLGLRRSWYQRKGANDVAWHYDVTPNKRAQAVRLGAQEVDHGFIARLMDHRRRERDGVPGGFVCGNDPNVVLTDGDRRVVDEFKAFLARRQEGGPQHVLRCNRPEGGHEAHDWELRPGKVARCFGEREPRP